MKVAIIGTGYVGRITSYNVCYTKLLRRMFGSTRTHLERIELQRTMAKQYGVIIVLKGGYTSIADEKGYCYFNILVITSYSIHYTKLYEEVMLDYAVFMLKKDKEIAPFDLLGLEDENKYAFNFNGKDRVNLYGIIDRVHQKENTVYLVDYKSGKRKSGKPDDLNTLFLSSAKRQSHWFQVLFYALIYSDKRKNAEIAPELYYLPELFTNFDPKVVLPESGGSAIITGNVFEKYQILLKNLLSDLFDPAVSFVQTNDYPLCERCDSRSICQR